MKRYLRVNLLGPDPRLVKKRIYQAAVSQRLRNTDLDSTQSPMVSPNNINYDPVLIHNNCHKRIY